MSAFQYGRSAMIALTALAAFSWSGERPRSAGMFFGQAEARVGRPATPMSYAGVARRTTRRAAVVGAGAAVAGGAYYYGTTSGCYQVVNSYGQIVTRCP